MYGAGGKNQNLRKEHKFGVSQPGHKLYFCHILPDGQIGTPPMSVPSPIKWAPSNFLMVVHAESRGYLPAIY